MTLREMLRTQRVSTEGVDLKAHSLGEFVLWGFSGVLGFPRVPTCRVQGLIGSALPLVPHAP